MNYIVSAWSILRTEHRIIGTLIGGRKHKPGMKNDYKQYKNHITIHFSFTIIIDAGGSSSCTDQTNR